MPAKIAAKPDPKRSLLRWCAGRPVTCFSLGALVWVFLLYHQALNAPFLYDDLDQVVNNPSLHTWTTVASRFLRAPVVFSSSFLGRGGSTYRPIFWLSLAVDGHLWGVDTPSGFHLTNLLLHWLNGVLLFQLLRKLDLGSAVAAVGSLLWLGLPVNSETVAWVSARAYLLSTCFLLLALLAACRLVHSKPTWPALLWFSLSAAGAVFSHEQGLLLLPLVALLLYARLPWRNPATRRLWLLLTGIPAAAGVLYLCVRYGVGAKAGQGASHAWLAGEVFWKYLQIILLPVHLSLERSTSLPTHASGLLPLAGWAGVLALLCAAYTLRHRQPFVSTALLAGCIGLAPYCGFVYIYQGMAERFTYLAAIGFTVALVAAAFAAPLPRRAWLAGCALLWAGWGAWRTTTRVQDWTSPIALYRDSLLATPNSPYLHYNLGLALRDNGERDQARQNFQRALQLRPDYPEAITSVADIDAQQGKTADALVEYRQSLQLKPQDGKTVINYGAALLQAGDKTGAEQQFKRVIALAPRDSAAYVNLGALYAGEGRTDEAIQSFETAISVNPSDPNAYFDMATMFQQRGQDDVALAFYKKALQLNPNDPQTLSATSKLHAQ